MSAQMKVPKLRFPEFSGEWEKKKLGSYGKLVNGLTYSPDNIVENGLLVLRSSNVQNNQLTFDDNVYVNLEVSEESLTKENDILICVRNGSKRLIGKSVIIPANLPKTTHGAFMTVFRGESNLFISHWLKTPMYYKQVHQNLGATINSINGSDFKKFKTIFPLKSEEQKIATFLSAIDTKVDLVSKQQTLLKQYKKGVMQKIFSQELRFKADDGSEFSEWEEKEFKKFGKFYYGKGIPKTVVVKNGKNPCIRYGELYSTHKEIVKEIKSFTNLNLTSMKLSKGGEVLIPRVGEKALDFAKASFLPFKGVGIGEMISVFETQENGLYLSYYINSMLINSFAKVVEGGSVSNLYFRYLEKISIPLPSLKEQTKIADFLTVIDTKLDLATKQLEEAKQFKKALLQQMFV